MAASASSTNFGIHLWDTQKRMMEAMAAPKEILKGARAPNEIDVFGPLAAALTAIRDEAMQPGCVLVAQEWGS